MIDVLEIQIDNLREALRLLQRCLVTALATSISLLLLEFAAIAPDQPEPTYQMPWVYVAVAAGTAKLLIFVAYSAAAFVAFAAILHIKHTARLIADTKIREAVLGYPTIATMTDRSLTGFSIAIPPMLFTIAAAHYIFWGEAVGSDPGNLVIGALILGVAPYIAIFFHWRSGFGGDAATAAAQKSDKPPAQGS
jgi:hypothetical protein